MALHEGRLHFDPMAITASSASCKSSSLTLTGVAAATAVTGFTADVLDEVVVGVPYTSTPSFVVVVGRGAVLEVMAAGVVALLLG